MDWSKFLYFMLPAVLLWIIGGIGVLTKSRIQKSAVLFYSLGIVLILIFAIGLWLTLGRPPLRTMGETRLWYSIYISIAGLFVYVKWKYKWMLGYSAAISTVFLLLIYFFPDVQNKNLMPALQSPWFVPHVSVYIISYALMGVATVLGIRGLIIYKSGNSIPDTYTQRIDRMVYVGLGFLLLGLTMGALWAKTAWSNYWSWDPKETWAFITCVIYLIFIHLRKSYPKLVRSSLIILTFAFISLLITWKGVNYLPSARNSMHTYTEE
ncbi:MAG: cytochrome c biogenesis protein [Bacteroidales bacterium]